jgi:hypothetical protein
MKKKTVILSIFALLLTSLICCILSLQYISHGCFWWECAPERNFHVLDWEMPTYLFPETAIVNHIHMPSELGAEIENGWQDVFWQYDNRYGTSAYQIERYSSKKAAIGGFKFEIKQMTDPSNPSNNWVRPNESTFVSSTADEVYIACGRALQEKNCGVVARYQEYVILFSTTIDEKMTYSNFEKVLFYLDAQISRHLYP